MAKYLKRQEGIEVSHVFVADLWREHGLKPHRQDTFKLSKDPFFAEKVADIVGLYLAPPAAAVVLCVDEKSGVQALDRTQPLLPLTFDKTEKRTHYYVRHGTVTLFGALDVATGKVTGKCYPRRGSEEFLTFMKTVAAQYADREVHVVVGNLGTHFTLGVRDWLAANPNITFHRTPVEASWINQIEIWFGLITRQAIRRGTFSSVNNSSLRSRTTSPTVNRSPGPPMPTQSLPKFDGSNQKFRSLRDTRGKQRLKYSARFTATTFSPWATISAGQRLPVCSYTRQLVTGTFEEMQGALNADNSFMLIAACTCLVAGDAGDVARAWELAASAVEDS
jgi:hypothetical protein